MKKTGFRWITLTLLAVSTSLISLTLEEENEEFEIRKDQSELEWKAYKVGGEHWGSVDIKSGSMIINGTAIQKGDFTIDMTTIKVLDAPSKKLENHLRSSDFFDIKNYPESHLEITGSAPLENGNQEVTGNLTIVGKTHPITFETEILAQTKDVIIYKAVLIVNRVKYGIDYRSSLADAFIMDDFRVKAKIAVVRSNKS